MPRVYFFSLFIFFCLASLDKCEMPIENTNDKKKKNRFVFVCVCVFGQIYSNSLESAEPFALFID